MDTVKHFLEKVKADEELQKKMIALAENQNKDAFYTFMKENGVSGEDIAILEKQQEYFETTGELNDEMLANVSGGGCWSRVAEGFCLFMNFNKGGCAFLHAF